MESKKVIFSLGTVKISVILRDTPTAKAILEALPINSNAQTWGDEVYLSIPVESKLEADAKSVVEAGEIAFWVEGSCIAIGFGPTPISHGDEIRLAAETNIWADAVEDVSCLRKVSPQDPIHIELAEN